MKAQVDTYLCDGCGLCEQTCPELFAVNEHQARVRHDPVLPKLDESCRQAAIACPNQAIVVDE